MVTVYDGERVVARVKYNSRLDHWDGRNYSNGSVGNHLGITRLRDGRFVLIYGTQWQGERDRGQVVTDDEALQAIMSNNPDELDNWPTLQKLSETKLTPEV